VAVESGSMIEFFISICWEPMALPQMLLLNVLLMIAALVFHGCGRDRPPLSLLRLRVEDRGIGGGRDYGNWLIEVSLLYHKLVVGHSKLSRQLTEFAVLARSSKSLPVRVLLLAACASPSICQVLYLESPCGAQRDISCACCYDGGI
jgi:uncharacterized lipoprotein YmbA